MIRPLGALLFSSVLLMTACSDSAQKKAEMKEEATPEPPLTGRQAFQRMYPSARAWSPDAQPLTMQSYNLQQVKAGEGKAGAWQVTFVSPGKQRQKLFTWSAIEAEGNLHKGVFAGSEDSWNPGSQRPYLVAAIRTDSDEAYQVAMKQKATQDFLKKSTGDPIVYVLEQNSRFPDLSWRVMWGESVSSSKYSVFVDATSGKFLEKVI